MTNEEQEGDHDAPFINAGMELGLLRDRWAYFRKRSSIAVSQRFVRFLTMSFVVSSSLRWILLASQELAPQFPEVPPEREGMCEGGLSLLHSIR
jgi:hypothetical protein